MKLGGKTVIQSGSAFGGLVGTKTALQVARGAKEVRVVPATVQWALLAIQEGEKTCSQQVGQDGSGSELGAQMGTSILKVVVLAQVFAYDQCHCHWCNGSSAVLVLRDRCPAFPSYKCRTSLGTPCLGVLSG